MVAQNHSCAVKSIPWPRRALLRAASRGDIVVKTIWGATTQAFESLSPTDELVGSLMDENSASGHVQLAQPTDEFGEFFNSYLPVY